TRYIERARQNIMNERWTNSCTNAQYKASLINLKGVILVLGHISKIIIKRPNALGIEVRLHSQHTNLEKLKHEGLQAKIVDLKALFAEADIVSLHARVTSKNKNIVNQRLINLMKSSSYLINTARPGLF